MPSQPAADLREWFPMRVTYNRELKMKEILDDLQMENFLPMCQEIVGQDNNRQLKLVPAIHNLLFIRSTQDVITGLKITRRDLEPLRYMMRPVEGSTSQEIIRVPDKQMNDFIRVSTAEASQVMFLKYEKYLDKVGHRVKVMKGYFAGVEGVLKRIKNNRHVVVKIDGVAAVAIANVPAEYITVID